MNARVMHAARRNLNAKRAEPREGEIACTPHQAVRAVRWHAMQSYLKHPLPALGLCALRLALLAAIAALVYLGAQATAGSALSFGSITLSKDTLSLLMCVLAAVMLILGALPLRIYTYSRICLLSGATRRGRRQNRYTYSRLFRLSLMRVTRGFLWGVPFLGIALYFYMMFTSEYAWDMLRGLQNTYAFFTGSNDIAGATIAMIVLMVLSLGLWVYGWNRDMPMDFQPVGSIGVSNSVHRSARVRRAGRNMIARNFMLNALLMLPFIAAALVIVYMDVRIALSGKRDIIAMATSALNMISSGFQLRTYALLVAAYAVLAMPLAPYRKLANAALSHALGRAAHEARKEKETAERLKKEAEMEAQKAAAHDGTN